MNLEECLMVILCPAYGVHSSQSRYFVSLARLYKIWKSFWGCRHHKVFLEYFALVLEAGGWTKD
jgi:hypothetical protein